MSSTVVNEPEAIPGAYERRGRRIARLVVSRLGAARVRRLVYASAWLATLVTTAATVVVIVLFAPNGDDPRAVSGLFRGEIYPHHLFEHFTIPHANLLIRLVIFATGVLTVFVIWFNVTLTSRLIEVDSSPRGFLGRLLWTSETIFYTVFCVVVGIIGAIPLLVGQISDETVTALFVIAIVVASILAFVGIPYLWAVYRISARSGLFPRWMNTALLVCVVLSSSIGLGFLSLTGPLNAVNGLACITPNLAGLTLFYSLIAAWWFNEWLGGAEAAS